MKKQSLCVLCGEEGSDLFGYVVCASCKSKLGLFSDETIKRQNSEFKKSSRAKSYMEEIEYRLEFIEKDLIKKQIKLLHIQERLESLD